MPPFRLDLTAWALRRQPHNRIDRWDGRTYRRTLLVDDQPVETAVEQVGGPLAPRLRVTVTGLHVSLDTRRLVVPVLERLLGFRIDLSRFYRLARRDAALWRLVRPFRGLKPPRFPTLFETLVNGIACQQLSLTVGIELLNRLASAYGISLSSGDAHAFPRPQVFAPMRLHTLRRLGFSRQKSRAVIELARSISDGSADLETISALDDEAAVASLTELRGVGRWTAELVLLRGLGRLHIFPADDVGGRNKLQHWLRRRAPLDYTGVRRALSPWQGFGGLIYFHLLLQSLDEAGIIAGVSEASIRPGSSARTRPEA